MERRIASNKPRLGEKSLCVRLADKYLSGSMPATKEPRPRRMVTDRVRRLLTGDRVEGLVGTDVEYAVGHRGRRPKTRFGIGR